MIVLGNIDSTSEVGYRNYVLHHNASVAIVSIITASYIIISIGVGEISGWGKKPQAFTCARNKSRIIGTLRMMRV